MPVPGLGSLGAVLGLSARAVRRADEEAGHVVGVRLAVVLTQDVQAEISGRQHAAGAEDLAVVDEQLVVVQVHVGEGPAELVGQRPVGGDPVSRQHA